MGGFEIAILCIAGVAALAFGFAALYRRLTGFASWSLLLLAFAISIWAIATSLLLSAEKGYLPLISAQLYHITAAAVALAALLSVVSDRMKDYRPLGIAVFFTALFVTVASILWFSPQLILQSVEISAGVFSSIVVDPLGYAFYVLYIFMCFTVALVYLLGRFFGETNHRHRAQFLYTIIASLIAGMVGVTFNLILPALGNYELIWIGVVAAGLLVPLIYGINVLHGLYDMKDAAVRSIAYTATLVTLSAGYYGLALLVSAALSSITDGAVTDLISPLSVVLALVLAYVFQPIKNFFDRITNRIFFRAGYDVDVFTLRLSKVLNSTVALDELLDRAAQEIASTLKASHATFIVKTTEQNTVVRGYGNFRKFSSNLSDSLSQFTDKAESVVVSVDDMVGETYSHTGAGKFYRELAQKNVALIMSLHGGIGHLLLGEQRAAGYSRRDLRVMESVIGELSIAIQNAMSIQDLRELNMTLQQRIDNSTSELRHTNQKLRHLDATKDEFISMASHQLRTPLTSVKGYLSMVLDGDVGEITDPQRKMLTEAFTSSERMVHLIGDFLNVSRLQTGKFVIDAKVTDLSRVIQEEVDSMKRLATSHGITLEYIKPKSSPMMNLDVDKLRQVIMNFIDNAIYYSPENSTVKIKLTKSGGMLQLEVSDQGMGVPEEVQSRLFTKFFRAENARKQRPDGTGIGLYLAKKVVTAHGGDIIFRTKKGRGSIFGFTLPIDKLSAE